MNSCRTTVNMKNEKGKRVEKYERETKWEKEQKKMIYGKKKGGSKTDKKWKGKIRLGKRNFVRGVKDS